MPLPDDSRLVANLLEQFGEGLLAAIERVPISHKPVQMIVFTSLNDGSTWPADAIGAKAIGKQHALVGNAIEIRRLVNLRSVTAHRLSRMIVGKDEQDVRPPHRLSLNRFDVGWNQQDYDDGKENPHVLTLE
jgi:hypothetical protein